MRNETIHQSEPQKAASLLCKLQKVKDKFRHATSSILKVLGKQANFNNNQKKAQLSSLFPS